MNTILVAGSTVQFYSYMGYLHLHAGSQYTVRPATTVY